MVYRDTRDPRIGPLKQLLAGEPELRERRSRLRHEHDLLEERADILGREVAEAERGGVISTISGWLGNDSPNDELEKITTQLAQLVTDERAIDAELAKLEAARIELAELEAASFAALRAMPGPSGDELRALDAELAREATVIEDIRRILLAGDRVDEVVLAMGEAVAEERPTAITARGAVERIADYLHTFDTVRARHALWPGEQRVDLQRTQLATVAKARLEIVAKQARSIAACISRLHSRLGADLRDHERRHAALVKRQRELVDEAT
jgi:hypothetical protein